MKVLMLVDMEGASGITTDRLSWTRCHSDDWERFGRDRITADVAAAVRGVLAGGAEAVTVVDTHDTGDSLRPENLPPGAKVVGIHELLADGGASDHGLLFMVGLHAKARPSPSDPETAILPHTVHAPIEDLRYGHRSIGEIGMFAGYFGFLGLPLGLVTGDRAACDEARDLAATVEVAPVKDRLADGSEIALGDQEATALIAERAEAAVRRVAGKAPVVFPQPLRLEVTFRRPEMTAFELPSFMDRVDDRTLGATAENASQGLMVFYTGFQPGYMPAVQRLQDDDRAWLEGLKARFPSIDWAAPAFVAERERHGLVLSLGLWTADKRREAEAFLERRHTHQEG
jgi:D-amino peptidase